MPAERKRLAGALILLILVAPLTTAATSSWVGPSSVNTNGQSTTIAGFHAFGNATIQDAWLHVSDSPMAASSQTSLVWDIDDIVNGTLEGTTTNLVSGYLTLEDDETLSMISDFDDSPYTVDLASQYNPGPEPIAMIQYESATGYTPHPQCNNLTGYNLSAGYDEDNSGDISGHEITSTHVLCRTSHTVQGGNGRVANGSVVNGSFISSPTTLPAGNSTCSEGGILLVYGNDYGYYYDSNYALNSTEIDGELYFCNRPVYWEATVLDLGGTISGHSQTLSHGVVPSSAVEGSVVAATLPGSPFPAGLDTWLTMPIATNPSASLQINYTFSFSHWFHLDGSESGAWVEYKLKNSSGWGDWTWIEPTGGYPYTISNSTISVNGASPNSLPVFSGSTHSGWLHEELDVTTIPGISNASDIQFRFRVWSSDSASQKPGWYLDKVVLTNEGSGVGAWHHGCDITGYSYANYGTYCYYSNNVVGNLIQTVDLTNVTTLQFDVHWDLEGSIWDNACFEIGNPAGTNWVDISSTGTSSTATQCRSRSGNIPGYGYSDMNGQSYGDDSGGLVTIELDVPVAYRVNNARLKIVVQTDSSVQYGSPGGTSDPDGKEGLTVFGYRAYSSTGNRIFEQIYSPTTNITSSASSGVNEWRYQTLNSGHFLNDYGFDDSVASDPTVINAPGFLAHTEQNCDSAGCEWRLGFWDSSGPSTPASYPYSYAFAGEGSVASGVTNTSLMTPLYSVPMTGQTEFVFDNWICMDYFNYVGGALFIKVNTAGWQHFDPGTYTDTMYSFGTATVLDGLQMWDTVNCGSDEYTTNRIDLSPYRGDTIQFKFVAASKYSRTVSGWFLDNVGLRQANFSQPGTWLSPEFAVGQDDLFDWGMIEIEGKSDDNDNNTITGTLIDSSTMNPIPGYSDVEFPISLAGLDRSAHPQLRLRLNLDTQNPLSTPMISEIKIGGPRLLTADLSEINGWQISNSIELTDGALNASSVSGTITSEYIHSQRPIRGLSFSGNTSSNVYTEAFDSSGAPLGSAPKGGSVFFTTPQSGFSLEVSLPTNGYISSLAITPLYGEPARDVVIDATEDGSVDWAFPSSSGRGHYAWQTHLVSDQSSFGSGQAYESLTLNVGPSGTSVYSIVPVSSYVNSGLLSVSSDSDGFDSPVSISVGGSTVSTGSTSELFTSTLTAAQLTSINSLASGWTDSENNRDWRVIDFSLSSSSSQQITVSGLALGYTIFENVSGLGQQVADYHQANTQDDPPPVEIAIPFNFTAEMGAISIDGSLDFDYILTNRDFQVPQTLYPDGNTIEIVTKHHHLIDNSQLAHISLTGTASDGEVLEFIVANNQDGLWGLGNPVSFNQDSGSSVAPLDASSSYVEILTHNDGHDDVVVHWMFSVNWNWDDVDTINWIAKAMDAAGETVWPATATSGGSGMKAVENDIQIDSFEIRDEYGRVLSNQFSTFYPYTIKHGSDVNVTGTVRFQDSISHRPLSEHFSVGLNLSGNLYSLSSGSEGVFSGIINPPSSLSELSLSPVMITVGPTGSTIGAEDASGVTPQVTVRVDSNPPSVGPFEINTDIGLQTANGKVWEPIEPLTVFITTDESESRAEEIVLRYWREGVDDLNMDGIADETEYASIPMPLSSGLTGQQQIQFPGIDVSGVAFNGLVHMYVEGTDWAGNTYQEGGTGGGPGEENAWSTLVIATDEPTSIIPSGYNLDHEIGYLLPGISHSFSLQVNEPNGIQTLDNVTVMLCGDGPSNLGKFSYNPSNGELWAAPDSMVTPLSAQSSTVSSVVTELSLGFELSWDYPWEQGQLACKPSVYIEDDLTTVAYTNNIAELSWQLDNMFMALPDSLTDLTPPVIDMVDNLLYLRQGDEFGFEGRIVYAGSQVTATVIPDDLQAEVEVIYGTQEIEVVVDINPDGTFSGSLILPSRVPLDPEMAVSTKVLNIPGLGSSVTNSDYSVVVDSKAPQALFNLAEYPDSSLTILDSDMLGEVTVTVTMVDEIGMTDGPLQVSWVYIRANNPVAGTETTGELSMIIDGDGEDVYQSPLDMNPVNGMDVQTGDQIWFWITSTDKSGNENVGSGSDSAPRPVTIRIMEFMGSYTRSVIKPTTNPDMGEILTIETFWENPGKRDGELTVGLYELVDGQQWIQSLSTNRDGEQTISLAAESSSVYAEFEWEAWQAGQPNLYLIIDNDFDNPYQAITGINVKAPVADEEGESDSQLMLFGGVAVVVVLVVAILMSRGRDDDDLYYEDDDESYYEEDSWEYEGEDEDEDEEEEDEG